MRKRFASFSWMTSRNCCAGVIFSGGMGLMTSVIHDDVASDLNNVAGVDPEIDDEPAYAPSTVPTGSAERPE